MSVIYKYPLSTANKQTLMIPSINVVVNGMRRRLLPSEQVLHFDVQNGVPTIWCICDRGIPPEAVEVTTVLTGMEFNAQGLQHIGSYQLHNGTFVGHVFMK